MAGLLDALVIPRASALPSASLPPVSGSASFRFSEFRGLKVQPTRSSAKLSSTQKPARLGGRIVCEAQDTAVGGLCFLFVAPILYWIIFYPWIIFVVERSYFNFILC